MRNDLKLYEYQNKVLTDIENYLNEKKPIVLASAPSGGKTLMSIITIERFLAKKNNAKVLVLTHGTTVLRSQYYNRLISYSPDFTYCQIENSAQINTFNNCQVVVAIPVTLKNYIDLLPKFDLVIIDEAHHFYITKDDESVLKKILRKVKPKHQLLLTGSPSKFIKNKEDYNFSFVSSKTLFDSGQLSDVVVDLTSSKYIFNEEDYNINGDLLNNKANTISQTDTEGTLEIVMKSLVDRLKSRFKNDPSKYSFFQRNKLNHITGIWNEIGKTLIACKSKLMADQVHNYLNSKNIMSLVSHSDNDKDSMNFDTFISDDNLKILIVVDRGILGFDLDKLETVIDMTQSRNPDMIFQLKARVMRKHPTIKKKLFVKVAPSNMKDYFRLIMNFTACLYFDKYYTKYNGKNFKEFNIPVKKNNTVKSNSKKKSKTNKIYSIIDFTDMPEIDFFNSILHSDDNELSTYAYANINQIMANEFGNNIFWNKQLCYEEARKYSTIIEWEKNSVSSYAFAIKQDWYSELKKELFPNSRIKWNKELCYEEARKYSTIIEWYKNSRGSSYAFAIKQDWYQDLIKELFPNSRIKWNKELCYEEAKKYSSLSEWQKNSRGSYNFAIKQDLYPELKKEIFPNTKDFRWNKELCYEEAKKYSTIIEWDKNSRGSYGYAIKQDWYPELKKEIFNK
jgi:superfamily II DNA or RNA helicase